VSIFRRAASSGFRYSGTTVARHAATPPRPTAVHAQAKGAHWRTAAGSWQAHSTTAPVGSADSRPHPSARSAHPSAPPAPSFARAERHVRTPWSLPVFASVVSLAFVLVAITDHSPAVAAASEVTATAFQHEPQVVASSDDYEGTIERAQWEMTRVKVYGVAPAAGTPDPGTAKALALSMVEARGWPGEQYNCLVSLWNKESGWNAFANNPSSGAYGIPQALPGSKMASAGADWATNPATQITWGLGYIAARYGDPCGAWGHSQRVGWY
jgi:hypothetical protein